MYQLSTGGNISAKKYYNRTMNFKSLLKMSGILFQSAQAMRSSFDQQWPSYRWCCVCTHDTTKIHYDISAGGSKISISKL